MLQFLDNGKYKVKKKVRNPAASQKNSILHSAALTGL